MNFQGSGINIIKPVTHQYYSTKTEDIRRYIERMEDLNDEKTEDAKVDISEFMKQMEKTANSILRKTITRRIIKRDEYKEQEKPWFTEEIGREISKRRRLNKEKRKIHNDDIRNEKENLYKLQKEIVKEKIKAAIKKHEARVVQEIKLDTSNRKLWLNIKKLKEINNTEREIRLCGDDGKLLNEVEERKQLRETWKQIYQKHENKIDEEWNEGMRNEYRVDEVSSITIRKYQNIPENIHINIHMPIDVKETITFHRNIQEHMDLVFRV